MADLVEQILDYERSVGPHPSGSFAPDVFRQLAALLPTRVRRSIETGTGKSTILLSNISDSHVVFTLDDRDMKISSLRQVTECPLFRSDTTELVLGPTQRTLPAYSFRTEIDVALLDGPHAYPFPELEYYFIYPWLKEGGLLIIDDIHIPTIRHMFKVPREDAMFDVVRVWSTTAVLRRTAAPVFDPLADGWWNQAYNARRFRGRSTAKLIRFLRKLGLYTPVRALYRWSKQRAA